MALILFNKTNTRMQLRKMRMITLATFLHEGLHITGTSNIKYTRLKSLVTRI